MTCFKLIMSPRVRGISPSKWLVCNHLDYHTIQFFKLNEGVDVVWQITAKAIIIKLSVIK
jgi:hypothetical protein